MKHEVPSGETLFHWIGPRVSQDRTSCFTGKDLFENQRSQSNETPCIYVSVCGWNFIVLSFFSGTGPSFARSRLREIISLSFFLSPCPWKIDRLSFWSRLLFFLKKNQKKERPLPPKGGRGRQHHPKLEGRKAPLPTLGGAVFFFHSFCRWCCLAFCSSGSWCFAPLFCGEGNKTIEPVNAKIEEAMKNEKKNKKQKWWANPPPEKKGQPQPEEGRANLAPRRKDKPPSPRADPNPKGQLLSSFPRPRKEIMIFLWTVVVIIIIVIIIVIIMIIMILPFLGFGLTLLSSGGSWPFLPLVGNWPFLPFLLGVGAGPTQPREGRPLPLPPPSPSLGTPTQEKEGPTPTPRWKANRSQS